jgi:DNA processing protein
MSVNDEVLYSLALNGLGGLGPAALRDLLSTYGSAHAVFDAGPTAWAKTTKYSFDNDLTTVDLGPSLGRAHADAELAERDGARIYLAHAGPYPALLRQTSCPPPVLYVAGEDVTADRPAVAIVGSRICTHYGEKIARRFSEGLASAGVVTISGLARGIDTRVHESALGAGGSTWAVVGSGLLMTYPPENRGLAERIRAQGAVVSEFPMATKPHPANFPRRNRIIAGLSSATVVVEGGETSGALITARLAAEEGRDVFAVPGPAGAALSRAPHRLLREGACLAESVDDILEELGWPKGIQVKTEVDRPEEIGPTRMIMDVVSDVPLDRDELLSRTALDAKAVATLIVQLEMRGMIKSLPGGKLVRV